MATVVRKRPAEKEESLIARFRRKVQAEQIIAEFRDREFYKPPSVKKKEKLALSRRRKRSRR